MKRWRMVNLGDVTEVSAGNPAPQEPGDFAPDGPPFVRMQDVGREHHSKSLVVTTDKLAPDSAQRNRLRLYPRGTLLVPKSGASVNLNHRALLGVDAYVVSHLATVVPDTGVIDPEFLYYWSLTYDPRHQAQTTSLPSLPTALIKAAALPLPEMDEQRRIVDLLSRAEGIVRLRREAQKKAAEIIPALFLDMFGDPATNPKGWDEAPLGHLVVEFRYGTSQKSGVSGIPTLRIPNVVGDRLDASDMKLVDVSEIEGTRLRLVKGDLLFVRTNGNPDYVGRSAVFDPEIMSSAGFDGANCVFASYLIRARLKPNSVRPGFLQSFLSSHEGRKRLRERARTSAGQYNINAEGLASIRVPVPPEDLQSRFEGRCCAVFGIAAQQADALAKAEFAFQSLLARTLGSERAAILAATAETPTV